MDRYYRVILRGDRLNKEVSSVLYCLGAVRNRVDDKIYIVALYRVETFQGEWIETMVSVIVASFNIFFFVLRDFEILKYYGEFWYTFVHESIITFRLKIIATKDI